MNKYELYNRVLTAINEDEGTFNAAARNWIEGADVAIFGNEKAEELFMKAKQCCIAWRKGAINGRISKRRMIDYVREIVEMNLPNPYDPHEVIEKPIEIVEEKVVEEKNENKTVEEKVVETIEPVHVFGVVPDEKISEPEKNEPVIEDSKAEKQKEAPKEEKRLFGKRKNR